MAPHPTHRTVSGRSVCFSARYRSRMAWNAFIKTKSPQEEPEQERQPNQLLNGLMKRTEGYRLKNVQVGPHVGALPVPFPPFMLLIVRNSQTLRSLRVVSDFSAGRRMWPNTDDQAL